MKALKIFALIFMVATITCDPVEQFLDTVIEGLEFLADLTDGSKIKLEECSDNPIYKPLNKKVTPDSIIKGENLTIKVNGVFLSDQHVQDLNIVTFKDGTKMDEQTIDKSVDKKKNEHWVWEYGSFVPAFVPAGHWETFIRLRDADHKELCCIKASWDI
jgi:hypothetical protein